MKILNQLNFSQINKINLKKENTFAKTSDISEDNLKNFSNAITSTFKGLISFQSRKKIFEPNKEMIIKSYEEGKSEEEIAQTLNCSPNSISKALINWGAKPKYFTPVQQNKAQIVELVDKNTSIREISEMTGISFSTIQRALKKWGIEIKNIDDKKDEILELLKENKSKEEIADALGYSVSTLKKAINGWGIKIYNSMEDKKDEIIKLYQEGYSQTEIAKMLNLSQVSIGSAMKRWGVELRQKGNMLNDKKDEIIYLYTIEEKTQQEIADMYNCVPDTVRKALTEWGIKIRNPKVVESNKDKIIELYLEGKTLNEIASDYSTYPDTIKRALIRWGYIEHTRKPKAINRVELFKDEIIKLHNEGKSQTEIAKITGCTQPNISKAFALWGITTPKENPLTSITEKNKDLIIELYKKGKNFVEIGKIVNCHYTTISYALRKWGIISDSNNLEERNKQIVELRKSGKTIREIASICNCSLSTVVKTVRKSKQNEE